MNGIKMPNYKSMRAAVHYITAAVIMPIYGIQVCPFIDSLPAIEIIIPIFIALSLQYTFRRTMINFLVENSALETQTNRAFKMELGLFVFTALALAIYNTVVYGFPLTSGLKVFVGIFGLGFFAAIDLALERERIVGKIIEETGADLNPEKVYFPLSQRVSFFLVLAFSLLPSVF